MKRIFEIFFAAALIAATLGASPVEAASTCGATYTVVRGDYLSRIGRLCGTTVQALVAANPWITNWNRIFPGQVLNIPGGQVPDTGGTVYTVRPGDTMRKIAARFGVSLASLIQANPSIPNPNLIFVGQVINLPANVSQTYTVQRGDYLRSIAARFNTNVAMILNANTFITNPGIIFVGQQLVLPTGSNSPAVAATPRSGVAGSRIFVVAGGFPANQQVALDLGRQGQALSTVLTTQTDSTGYLNRVVTIPSSAVAGEKWVAQVRTTDLAQNVAVMSGSFTVK